MYALAEHNNTAGVIPPSTGQQVRGCVGRGWGEIPGKALASIRVRYTQVTYATIVRVRAIILALDLLCNSKHVTCKKKVKASLRTVVITPVLRAH